MPGQTELFAVIGGENGKAGLWALDHANDSYLEKYHISSHTACISSIAFHPLNEYAALGSLDGSWSYHNLFQGVELAKFKEESPVTQLEFHPDGLMMMVGLADGRVKVYDIRTQQAIFSIDDYKGTCGEVKQISFSNKGLYFATTWKDSKVARVFNLRKLGKEVIEVGPFGEDKVTTATFDYYGNYLAIGHGKSICVVEAKKWNEPLVTIPNAHDGAVNVVRFAPSG